MFCGSSCVKLKYGENCFDMTHTHTHTCRGRGGHPEKICERHKKMVMIARESYYYSGLCLVSVLVARSYHNDGRRKRLQWNYSVKMFRRYPRRWRSSGGGMWETNMSATHSSEWKWTWMWNIFDIIHTDPAITASSKREFWCALALDNVRMIFLSTFISFCALYKFSDASIPVRSGCFFMNNLRLATDLLNEPWEDTVQRIYLKGNPTEYPEWLVLSHTWAALERL